MKNIYTTGEIAKMLNLPIYTVVHRIKTRKIEPAYKVGQARVFDEKAVEKIKENKKERE